VSFEPGPYSAVTRRIFCYQVQAPGPSPSDLAMLWW